jgi:RNA polymerase sigma-70 factor (ECF subfamily)
MAAQPQPASRADAAEFDALLTRHGGAVYGFVRRLVGAEAAEDLTQEAWLAIWRALPGFRGEAKVTTWMFTIAARACDRHRRRARLALVTDDDLGDLDDHRPGPEGRLLDQELAQVVRDAIDSLPARMREAVHLRCLEDQSYAEIAQVLGVPVGTVRSRLHYGMARLADRLAPYLETSDVQR